MPLKHRRPIPDTKTSETRAKTPPKSESHAKQNRPLASPRTVVSIQYFSSDHQESYPVAKLLKHTHGKMRTALTGAHSCAQASFFFSNSYNLYCETAKMTLKKCFKIWIQTFLKGATDNYKEQEGRHTNVKGSYL